MEGKVGEMMKKKRKVMVAIDESELSHYALEWTLQHLRHSFLNSELLLFTAQPTADLGYIFASSYGAAPPELVRSVQENQQKTALAILEKAKDICSKHGIVPETISEAGKPTEAICEAVEKLNVQLLILGSHGRGKLGRAVLGSVSNYCVHHATCPVLIVKKPH